MYSYAKAVTTFLNAEGGFQTDTDACNGGITCPVQANVETSYTGSIHVNPSVTDVEVSPIFL